jgi:hypothetical protein
MSSLSILYILINYIFLMSITIYTVVKKVNFVEYISTILIVCFCLNLSIIAFEVILKIFKTTNKSTFELEIADSKEDIKKLLNEAREEEEKEISEYIDNENEEMKELEQEEIEEENM